jgi:acyl-CoA thioesterase-2
VSGSLDSPLVAFLDLERDGDVFRPGPRVREGGMFGGELLALGLRSAAATVEGAVPHSLHAYFLRGRRDGELTARVAALRDGRSMSVRQVSVWSGDDELFTMTASFHRAEARDDWSRPLPTAPDPEGAGPWKDDPYTRLDDTLPFDIRHVEVPGPGAESSTARLWARAHGPLPDDPVLHACGQAMVSDMRTGAAAAHHVRSPWSGLASLDHAMWFHRQARADEWFLVDIRPLSAGGGRGLVVGSVHAIDGVQAASFAQEVLVRTGATQ